MAHHDKSHDIIAMGKILGFLQKTLVGRQFVGEYTERSHVNSMKFYR